MVLTVKTTIKCLPLKERQKIAVIGDFARELRFQGAGSSGVNPTK